jgi:hypothetical protein
MKSDSSRPVWKKIGKIALISAVSIAVVAVCCVLPVLYAIFQDDIRAWRAVRQTSRQLPEAQIRFEAMLEQISAIRADTVLEEAMTPLYVPERFFAHCIRGAVYWTFGTDRPYEDVVADYLEAFVDLDWQHFAVAQNEDHHIFKSNTGRVSIYPLDLSSDFDPDAYQTFYALRFSYAEPSYGDCIGL